MDAQVSSLPKRALLASTWDTSSVRWIREDGRCDSPERYNECIDVWKRPQECIALALFLGCRKILGRWYKLCNTPPVLDPPAVRLHRTNPRPKLHTGYLQLRQGTPKATKSSWFWMRSRSLQDDSTTSLMNKPGRKAIWVRVPNLSIHWGTRIADNYIELTADSYKTIYRCFINCVALSISTISKEHFLCPKGVVL